MDFGITTTERCQLVDITGEVRRAVGASGVRDGLCLVWCPHTTAGITVNENADPDVPADLLMGLARVVDARWPFRHGEGNSDAHLKSTLVGCERTLAVRGGELRLGTWQAIWFCEFDGPRSRRVEVQVLPG
ncbi:MAG TPA: secondary thiamine-phosphate synthase enzyme YjbQ [Candidatus Methanoperedens sp.]|nr:secondary thiamine-phosphate synthase enzyme YjbQ [Candidatus Methanoperedens sp.]